MRKKTYLYIQDGHEEGPYFESQIIRMADSGIIRADAVIKCVDDGAKGPLSKFLTSIEKELNGSVAVSDVKMPFGSMVAFMVKWSIASIPAAIILFVVFAVLAGLFWTTLFTSLRR